MGGSHLSLLHRDNFPAGQFTPRYILPFTIDLKIITRGESCPRVEQFAPGIHPETIYPALYFALGRTIYPGYSDVSDKVKYGVSCLWVGQCTPGIVM